MLEACHRYLSDSVASAGPDWAWLTYNATHALGMTDAADGVAVEVAAQALTQRAFLPLLSALLALQSRSNSRLKLLRAGIGRRVRGAGASEALLVVVLLQLDQFVAGDAALRTTLEPSTPGYENSCGDWSGSAWQQDQQQQQHGDCSGSGGEGCSGGAAPLPQLPEAALLSLLGCVDWDSLHAAEVVALTSQAGGVRCRTPCVASIERALLQQAAWRMVQRWDSSSRPAAGAQVARYAAGSLEVATLARPPRAGESKRMAPGGCEGLAAAAGRVMLSAAHNGSGVCVCVCVLGAGGCSAGGKGQAT